MREACAVKHGEWLLSVSRGVAKRAMPSSEAWDGQQMHTDAIEGAVVILNL